jgi:hypothetical protein
MESANDTNRDSEFVSEESAITLSNHPLRPIRANHASAKKRHRNSTFDASDVKVLKKEENRKNEEKEEEKERCPFNESIN